MILKAKKFKKSLLKKENILEYLKNEKCFFNKRNFKLFNELASTNDYLLKDKDDLPTKLVVAKSQTKGRGRFDHQWISLKNTGFFFSLKMRTNKTIKPISVHVAISILHVFERFHFGGIKIKWPNDIMYGDKKLAGILIETISRKNKSYVVIGVGINVSLPKNLGEQYADLSCIKKTFFNWNRLFASIVKQIIFDFKKYFSPKDHFLKEYAKYDYLKDKEIVISGKKGKYIGLDDNFNLCLQFDGKILKYINGDLYANTSGIIR